MAYPTIQSVTVTTVTSDLTTHNVNMPATVTTGDLLLALFVNNAVGTDATVTTPSGWTLVVSSLQTGRFRIGLYAKSATGIEDGTTVNFTTSVAEKAAAQVYRITGWYGSIPTGIEVSSVSGSGESPNPGALDPTNWDIEQTLWIAAFGTCTAALSAVSAYPSSYSGGTLTTTGSASDTSNAHLASAYRNNAVSSENPGTFTKNGTSAKEWIAYTIAIRPQYVSQTVEMPLLTNDSVFYDPAFSQYGLLIPILLDGTPTLYSPTFVYEQALSPDVLVITPAFYGPAVATVMTVPLVDGTPIFYSPEIINTQILTVPLISNSPTFYGPELRGPQNVEMPLIANTSVFYSPYIFGTWRDTDLPYGSGEW